VAWPVIGGQGYMGGRKKKKKKKKSYEIRFVGGITCQFNAYFHKIIYVL
jgi:hypothetical protein